jgi:hypothetical protein
LKLEKERKRIEREKMLYETKQREQAIIAQVGDFLVLNLNYFQFQ